MALARAYNKLFKSRLLHYAAWDPVVVDYAVGDYGAFKGGVFVRLGNIAEFGVEPQTRSGSSSVAFDFTASSATIVRSTASGVVDVFPEGDIAAKLAIEFSGDSSFYVRTRTLTVTELTAVEATAHRLRRAETADGRAWKLGYRVVHRVLTADNPAILMSSEKGASFTLSGTADALAKLELGDASAEISVSSTKQDAVTIVGGHGPIALDLFKVRWLDGGAGLESIGGGPAVELDADWPDDPDDDPDDLPTQQRP